MIWMQFQQISIHNAMTYSATKPNPNVTEYYPMPALDAPRQIRTAGVLYLVIIISGLTAELALRGPALGGGAETLVTHLSSIRLSLLADVIMLLADIALALVFFTLLRPVSEALSRAAMVFRLGQAALIGTSLVALSPVPELVEGGGTDLALTFAALHASGYDIGLILFGVNAMLMAKLVCLSRVAPMALPAGLMLTGLVYIAGGITRLAAPDLNVLMQPAYLVCIMTEVGFCLWLLIAGRL